MLAIKIYQFFRRFRWLLFSLVLSLISFFGFFASKIHLEEDINKFIPRDKKLSEVNFVLENLKIKDKLVLNFYLQDSSANNLDLLKECAESLSDSLIAADTSKYVRELTCKVSEDLMLQVYETFYQHLPLFLEEKDYQKLADFSHPDSIPQILENDYKTLLSPSSFALGKFIVKDPLNFTPLALKKMQDLQFDENFEVDEGFITTKDKKNVLVFINSDVPSNQTKKLQEFFTVLDKVIANHQEQFKGKVNIEYYGAAAVSMGNATQIKQDSIFTSIFAIVLIAVLMIWFFRNVFSVVVMLLPVVFGALFSLCIFYFLKGEISAIALGSGSIVLGIAINYSLHFFTHFKHEQDIGKVLKDLTVPMLIGCTTTVGAFLSLQLAKSQALHDFGLFAGLSLIGAVLFSILVLPHLLRKNKNSNSSSAHQGLNWLEKIATYPYEKNKWLVGTAFVLTLVFGYFAGKVDFESDMFKINYQNEKLTKAQENLDRLNQFSLRSVYLVAKGENLNAALKNSEVAREKLVQLKQEGVVNKFSSPSTLLISDSLQEVRIARWNKFWTSAKKDSLKQNLLKHSIALGFKPDAFASFYALMDQDFKVVPLSELDSLKNLVVGDWITEKPNLSTVVTLLKVQPETKNKVYESFSALPDVVVFDKQQMSSLFVEIIKSDFTSILTITALLVFGFMLLAHGRIELAIINFMPMFVSWLWILGLMALLGIKFNIINIIISTFIFGLGDDYSIFIMDGLGEQYRYGRKKIDSFKVSILLSALTAVIGMGVLIFAQHPALESIALISIIGMGTVLLISFIVQPILYNFLILNRVKKGLLPYQLFHLALTAFGFLFFLAGSIFMNIAAFILFYLTPLPLEKRKIAFHYLLMYFCRLEIYLFLNVKKNIINPHNEQFKTPAIVVANHQSHIDLALTLMLHPKLVVFTNDWVWNSPFYGWIVKKADFYPASRGFDSSVETMRALVKKGYSILIFPEGTRSASGDILRFHKGAMFLSEQLQVDVLPLLIHGAGEIIGKGDFVFKESPLSLKFLPRIKHDDPQFGEGFSQRTKALCSHMRTEYAELKKQMETVHYFRPRLLKNYLYKGPILEWYCKIKVKLEGNYELFESYLPKSGKIVDVGCGYGFLPYMLSFSGPNRQILGIDYDEEKINIADHCVSKTANMRFECADVTQFNYENADAFIISDVLHYLTPDQQSSLIQKCAEKLNKNGVLIIRDGDAEKKQRHWGTRYTEFFSTNSGFNQTKETGLHFTSSSQIKKVLDSMNFITYDIIDNTKLTSNIIFVIRAK